MSQLKVPVTSRDHVKGNPSAPIVLVEYGDYQCPACGAAFPDVEELMESLGDEMCFVFRNFPLTEIHEYALLGALAAEAAGMQGKFWEMHDMIYENQEDLTPAGIMEFARELDLIIPRFERALEDESLKERIQSDFMGGVESDVNGTPSFYLNGAKYEGPLDPRWIRESIPKSA